MTQNYGLDGAAVSWVLVGNEDQIQRPLVFK